MLWDGLIVVFIVLTLGAAFGAAPLSMLSCGRWLQRRQPSRPLAPAAEPPSHKADVIAFPAMRAGHAAEFDEAGEKARRA